MNGEYALILSFSLVYLIYENKLIFNESIKKEKVTDHVIGNKNALLKNITLN